MAWFWGGAMNDVLKLWREAAPLIHKGYDVLDKQVIMELPGPCMPPESADCDTGIGSPYGAGADKVADFFKTVCHKIMLGPAGKTNAEARHSPYVSGVAHNPFFIPLEYLADEGLLAKGTLAKIYESPKENGKINFAQVEKDYDKALKEAFAKADTELSFTDFVQKLALKYGKKAPMPYIGDMQVKIPLELYRNNPEWILKDFTLGSPPDKFSGLPRRWNFPVLNPDFIFDKTGKLGPAGRLWLDWVNANMQANRGGLRVDHFIGFVNPYVIYKDDKVPCGRLYSSPENPLLGKYAKTALDDFAEITEKILLRAATDNSLSVSDIYIEDLGARPEQLDYVIEKCGLGRLLVSEFIEPENDTHIYRLKNAKTSDVAALDTHDTASVQSFYAQMSLPEREKHARQLAQDLRWEYKDGLREVSALVRMKWAELLASPAGRSVAFFTSFIGQDGRYNQPGNPDKWTLRMNTDFAKLYFANLMRGIAYNPFDAIAAAIYARGDDCYNANVELIEELRSYEDRLKRQSSKIINK